MILSHRFLFFLSFPWFLKTWLGIEAHASKFQIFQYLFIPIMCTIISSVTWAKQAIGVKARHSVLVGRLNLFARILVD